MSNRSIPEILKTLIGMPILEDCTMNESTFSQRINHAVREYCTRKNFESRDLAPSTNRQGAADHGTYPFDIALSIPQSKILLLETKVVDWPTQKARFQPEQLEWLKVLWEVGVPIQLCYAMDVNMSVNPADPAQGRPGSFVLQNSRVSPPPRFLDVHRQVSYRLHETLNAHLERLTADDSSTSPQGIFACVDPRLCDIFENLTSSTLVVLYNKATREITTLSGELFMEVFAELKKAVELSVNLESVTDSRVTDLANEINRALEERAHLISQALKRHVYVPRPLPEITVRPPTWQQKSPGEDHGVSMGM